MKNYFCYDPNGSGITFHETEEEARKEAVSVLDAEAEGAVEGWSEEVTEICWGKIQQRVMEKNRRPVTPDDYCYGQCDEVVDYELVDAGA